MFSVFNVRTPSFKALVRISNQKQAMKFRQSKEEEIQFYNQILSDNMSNYYNNHLQLIAKT